MASRIVKETLGDGRVRYRVETNRLLGFIPIPWTTDVYKVDCFGFDYTIPAIFDNLLDAQCFCGIIPDKDKIVKNKVL